DRHRLADDSDRVGGQWKRDVAERLRHNTGCGRQATGDVVDRVDADDAWQRARRGGVDLQNPRVGVRAAHEDGVEGLFSPQIVNVRSLTPQQPRVLNPLAANADAPLHYATSPGPTRIKPIRRRALL